MKGFCENSLCETRAITKRGRLCLCACCADAFDLGFRAGVHEPTQELAVKSLGFTEMSECDNCGKVHDVWGLQVIHDYDLRVDASGPVPSGQCPDCGALCYPVKAKETV